MTKTYGTGKYLQISDKGFITKVNKELNTIQEQKPNYPAKNRVKDLNRHFSEELKAQLICEMMLNITSH